MNNWAVHILKNTSDKVAIIDDYGSISYKHLGVKVQNYATYLYQQNIGPSDRVLITSDNNIDTVVAILAVTYIGGTVCMLSPNCSDEKITESISDTNACMHIKEGDVVYTSIGPVPDPYNYPEDAEGFMMTTSGSTGYQKYIRHKQSSYFKYLKLVDTCHGITEDSVIFCGPKLHWGYGYTINLIPGLGKGATIILTDKVKKPKEFCAMLDDNQVTILFTVPIFAELLVRSQPSQQEIDSIQRLQNIYVSGDICPKRIYNLFYEFYGRYMQNGWGQTEILSYATVNHAGEEVHPDYICVGRLIDGIEIKIDDDQVIWIKSPVQAIDYLDDPRSTDWTFKGDWVKTNDLGELDGEYLIFLNRRGNRFKNRGRLYSVDEVEQAVLNTGLVRECLVTPKTNEGEVHLRVEIVADSDVTNDVKQVLTHFKMDKDIVMTEMLPKTYTNKKLRLKV